MAQGEKPNAMPSDRKLYWFWGSFPHVQDGLNCLD